MTSIQQAAYVSIRQHTYCSIRQHTSAYVAHTCNRHINDLHTASHTRPSTGFRLASKCPRIPPQAPCLQHTSAYVSIRQHASKCLRKPPQAPCLQHTSAYVSMRQHTSAYVSIRQHTSAYVSIRHKASLASRAFMSCTNSFTTIFTTSFTTCTRQRRRGALRPCRYQLYY
jgi:hypothetical protein